MIVEAPESNRDQLPMVDIGRPTFTDNDAIRLWLEFHDWIESVNFPIHINGMYRTMDSMMREGQYYVGGGFRYCFWFQTEADKQQFQERVAKLDADFQTLWRKRRESSQS